ncbi:MAG: tRNA (guanosine(37)-N1)-methyltransferase TrmD [Candidatus Muiribacteriaceae bacterium]
MRINFVTLFPDMVRQFFEHGMVGRYILENNNICINIVDLRKFGIADYRQVDDYSFGTGKSLVLRYDVISSCLESFDPGYTVLLSPGGKVFDNDRCIEYSHIDNLTFLCGRYEGFDSRVRRYVHDEISIGDYVLNGGETAAFVIAESMIRHMPDFTRQDNIIDESFMHGLIEGCVYTRPAEWNGDDVPDVLRSGDHRKINDFLRKKSLEKTMINREDLFIRKKLDDDDIGLMVGVINEQFNMPSA